jgi:parallel beta-helix repeat protein
MSNSGKSTFVVVLALLVGFSGVGLGAYSVFFQEPIAGPPGVDGTDGVDGIDGVDGTDGTDGVNGTDGEDGAGAGEPVYYCSSEAEINVALTAIGSGSGSITITQNIILTASIILNGNGGYIIQGVAPSITIDCNGDRSAIRIETTQSCIIRDLTIDATDVTSHTTNIIFVSDTYTYIENVRIFGDGDREGRGIYIDCANVWVTNCFVTEVLYGIYGLIGGAYYSHISDNTVTFCDDGSIGHGIYLGGDYSTCDNNFIAYCQTGIYSYGIQCAVSNNVLYDNALYGIWVYSAGATFSGNTIRGNNPISASNFYGIFLDSGADYNVISGNLISDYVNSGAGTGMGVRINTASCDETTIVGNTILNCDTAISDSGTNTFAINNNI